MKALDRPIVCRIGQMVFWYDGDWILVGLVTASESQVRAQKKARRAKSA